MKSLKKKQPVGEVICYHVRRSDVGRSLAHEIWGRVETITETDFKELQEKVIDKMESLGIDYNKAGVLA